MTKSFQLNQKKNREVKKANYKKHPLWEKNGIWIKIFLPLGWILMFTGIVSGLYGFINAPGSVLIDTLFLLMFPSMFVALFFTYRLKWLQSNSDDGTSRINSTLILNDTTLISSYTLPDMGYESRHIVEVPYEKIEKLIYNKRHKRLLIIGEGCLTIYDNYQKGQIYINESYSHVTGHPKWIKGKLSHEQGELNFNSDMVLYDIFDDFDQFMQEVSEQSKVTIQYIDEPEAIMQSKYNKADLYSSIN